MLKTAKSKPLVNGWSDTKAAQMSESEKLLYRSNLLGSDMRITNYGGGNTSAKVTETDPVTGELLGYRELQLGTATVVDVQERIAFARFTAANDSAVPTRNDLVTLLDR